MNSRPLTPMLAKPREPLSDSNPALTPKETELYQSKVGSVLWPTRMTRPECLFSVGTHSTYTKSPRRADMHTLNRILEFLVSTPELGLKLGGIGEVIAWCCVDVAYAKWEDCKSQTGCTLQV